MARAKLGVGVYIAAKTVDIVSLKESAGKIELVSHARVSIEEAGEAPVVDALLKAQQEAKIADKEVITALPSKETTIRFYHMPLIPARQREAAVRFEAKRYIPYKLEDLITASAVTQEKIPPRLNVLFAGARKEEVNSLIGFLNKAGEKPIAIDALPFALIRLFSHSGQLDKKLPSAIVNINDDDSASIFITRDGIPYLVRDVALDGARELAKRLGDELETSFDYYRRQFKVERVSKVIISGETDIERLIEPLNERLGMPVEAAVHIRGIKGTAELPPGAAVAIGLGLRGVLKPEKEEINLLPSGLIPVKEEILPVVIFQGSVFGGALLLAFIISQLSGAILSKAVETEELRAPKVQTEISEMPTPALEELKRRYEARRPLLNMLVRERILLTHKLNQIVKLLPQGAWLVSIAYKEETAAMHPGEFSPSKMQRTMAINGIVHAATRRDEVEYADKFLSALKNDKDFFDGFSEIRLKSTKVVRIGKNEMTAFELLCLFGEKM